MWLNFLFARSVASNWFMSPVITVILSAQGDACTFSLACAAASGSISTANNSDSGDLCAAMRAIRPVPVPMSRILLGLSWMVAHAPRSTPSVPTFMAHRFCQIVNCLNLKYWFLPIADVNCVVFACHEKQNHPHFCECFALVGMTRFEQATSWSQTKRSTN